MAKQTTRKPAEQRLTKARALLTVYAPFYGTLLHGLKLVECNEAWNPTMAVDGVHIFWNRTFVDGCTDAELLFVLAHEVGHPALLHHTRREGRDAMLWNMAGDYKINDGLILAGIGTMPKGGLHDPRFRPFGTEEVYAILASEQAKKQQPSQSGQSGSKSTAGGQNPAQGKGQASSGPQEPAGGQKAPGQGDSTSPAQPGSDGSPAGAGKAAELEAAMEAARACSAGEDAGGCGQVLDAAPDAAGKAEAEAEWQTQVRQAISVATKQAGKLPGHLAEIANVMGKPKINWREPLRRFVEPSSRTDYAWSSPDRRFMGRDFILPGQVSDGVHHIVVGRDTSGSIGSAEASAFNTELQALLDEGVVDRITVIDCDAKIHNVVEFNAGDEIDLKITGRGGTSYKPVWEWLAQNPDDAACVIYFTDLDPNDGFGEEPSLPVLWAATGSPDYLRRKIAAVPFGDVIVVEA